MPLKLKNITASSVDSFQIVQKQFEELQKMVQTINNVQINVNVETTMGGIRVIPDYSQIKEIRIVPPTKEGVWIDYEIEKQAIYIRTPETIYTICLTEPSKKL